MSRTNPNDSTPHPAKRWFQWSGNTGDLKYYDKDAQEEFHVPIPFEFILLDRLAVVRGWHDASESGITSNEVRRVMDEPLTVRAFKMKEPIARGLYADIKDRVKAEGGKFNTNLYIAYKTDTDDTLKLGSLMLHGAAMSAWFEFENDKGNRKMLYTDGIRITQFTEGKKGGITFRVPVFNFFSITPDIEAQAEELQKELAAYIARYLARKPTEASEPDDESSFQRAKRIMAEDEDQTTPDDDEIPF